MLSIGTQAPDFTLPDQNGELHSLSDFKGQKVILYFYSRGQHRRLHQAGVRIRRALSAVPRKRRGRARCQQGFRRIAQAL